MATREHLFNSAVLDVLVPEVSLEYPVPQTAADDWLRRLQNTNLERKQAFFDEQLQFFLTVRIDHPRTTSGVSEEDDPPFDLLEFLAHLQVSLEATYISPVPAPTPDPQSIRLSATPRTSSFGRLHAPSDAPTPRADVLHPSIFPPSTPNPMPSTAGEDRRYVRSEGTLLLASIWGQNSTEDSPEAFSLLWSTEQQVWVAIYCLGVTVSFLRLQVSDPLLCLTVSATLRDKPFNATQPKHPLAAYLASIGAVSDIMNPITPTIANGKFGNDDENTERLNGLEEVNLLEGLSAGPTFSATPSSRVFLPSTRLGGVTRRRLFSLPPLPPVTPTIPSPSPITSLRVIHPTLRKSFRKTLQTVSGFRVRMRTVFVPHVLLPGAHDNRPLDEDEDERERREAGNEERTVVLCVEVENTGESGPRVGFAVEAIDVNIGGDGAKATLIGWGDGGFSEESVFPILVGSMEQYNLLYAVSFFRSPEDVHGLFLATSTADKAGGPPSPDLQRAVAINIHGKPFLQPLSRQPDTSQCPMSPIDDAAAHPDSLSYPTHTFSSRWNCLLDLSPNQPRDAQDITEGTHNALPEPASPFPIFSPRTASALGMKTPFPIDSPPQSAGTKRHTIPENPPSRKLTIPSNYRASTPVPNAADQLQPPKTPNAPSRLSYLPPSIAVQPHTPTTTYDPPLSVMEDETYDANSNVASPSEYTREPLTPAYPAFPPNSALPPTPLSQAPITNHQAGSAGLSVEIRRERGLGLSGFGSGIPQTPGPLVMGGFGEQGMVMPGWHHPGGDGRSIVVSVGLLPVMRGGGTGGMWPGKVYPLDRFTLDIFVFNQSEWTRRFEVSSPYKKRTRKKDRGGDHLAGVGLRKAGNSPGILPLDNRVRIGPLQSLTCQSVRMEFLAVAPGVHSIDTLTLRDVESGFTMNLRSVMDIVVHEANV